MLSRSKSSPALEVPERARISPRHHRRADPPAESCLRPRLSASGHGRQRHAADVRLPRAGKDSRPVRSPHRLAHDVQLHALRRLPRRPARRLAGPARRRSSPASRLPRRVRSTARQQRNSDGAHPGRRRLTPANSPSMPGVTGPMLRATRRELRHPQSRQLRHLRPLRTSACRSASTATSTTATWSAFLEMRESLKILEQALRDHSRRPDHGPEAKLRGFRPKAGEAYGRIEAPRASSASTSSAMARRIRIATACARRASSISPCSKTCASATTSPTRSSSWAASTSCWAKWTDKQYHREKRACWAKASFKGLAETAQEFLRQLRQQRPPDHGAVSEERLPVAEAARDFPSSSTTATIRKPDCAASPARSARRNARPSASTSRRARIRSRRPSASRSSIPRTSTSTSPSA